MIGIHQHGPVVEASAVESDAEALNPWFAMWTRPRQTIRFLQREQPHRQMLLVTVLGGAAYSLSRALDGSAAQQMSLRSFLMVSALGGVAAFFTLWLGPLLLNVTGKRIGGRAEDDDLRIAVAWSYVPMAWALVMLIPGLALTGRSPLADVAVDTMSGLELLVFTLMAFTVAVTGAWYLVVLLKAVSEVQGFSFWKAILNLFLSSLVVFLPLFAVFLMILTALGG